ncbi:lytic transglycosylase domain-containing protein, partial [Bacillus altitudinis]|uniref:lytic transglycosylase domain-containing protein n=1 Tax=Bacillus altitudinis TaxID=293387 RepID=UPI00366BE416
IRLCVGGTISDTFSEYTAKIGETVSGWFSDVGKDFDNAIQSIKDFFTVDNLSKVFQDAFASVVEFLKHPVDSLTNGAGAALNKAKDAVSDGVSSAGSWISEKYHAAKTALTGDSGTPGAIQKGVEKAKAVAKNAGQTASETIAKVTNSSAVQSAQGALEKISASTGQSSVAAMNTARVASSNVTGTDNSDVMKAAQAYNNGNANVKVNSLSKEGEQNLQAMEPYLKTLESKYNLPEGILHSVAATESGGDPNAVSPTGAQGMFQFTKIARDDVGITKEQALDPYESADAAARLLVKYNKQAGGDWNDTLTGYNAGMGTVKNWRAGTGELSKENREYAIKVNAHREQYLGGAQFRKDFGSAGAAVASQTNALTTDASTGQQYAPSANPLRDGSTLDEVAGKFGLKGMIDKLRNAPGMRHQVATGSIADRAYGTGTNTAIG